MRADIAALCLLRRTEQDARSRGGISDRQSYCNRRAEYRAAARRSVQDFDPTPIGSASLACVYQAQLKTGERVAVKVRRPGSVRWSLPI
jgi:hypothetical protein